MKVKDQLSLFEKEKISDAKLSCLDKLTILLKGNLDFHSQPKPNSSYNFHSFPAKFPPQLPNLFIRELTKPNEVVLDPMVGSGTTLLEAYYLKRKAIAFDIDPLALKISKVKTNPISKIELLKLGKEIYNEAQHDILNKPENLKKEIQNKFNKKTRNFLDYWFLPETQLELFALLKHINEIKDEDYKTFFEIVFSSIIITKSGGVSLALDLGHTRPHKTKILKDKSDNIIIGNKYHDSSTKNDLIKILKSPIEEFEKRFSLNLNSLPEIIPNTIKPDIKYCDAQKLCLPNQSVDLIVTSPPYASNAIDYMRAHKFTLVWLGYDIEDLSEKRKKYIGSETTKDYHFEELPPLTTQKIERMTKIDKNRGQVLKRYFSEMKNVLKEMYRVLKSDKAAILVVGNSVMKGQDTETQKCLEEIGNSIGFIIPYIGIRKLDRNKRMLPAALKTDLNSQIQQRMHQEYVIGFYKS